MASRSVVQSLHNSGAETANGNSADFEIRQDGPIAFYADVTAASGTTPTLDITIEVKDPVSGKYFVVATFTQITAVTTQRQALSELADSIIRGVWVITGTTPSFTFTLSVATTDHA